MSAMQEVGGIGRWMQPYDVSQMGHICRNSTDFAGACVVRSSATCAGSLGSDAPALNTMGLAYWLELK